MMTKVKSRCESDDSDLLASLRRWEEEQEEKESLKKKITSEIIKKKTISGNISLHTSYNNMQNFVTTLC